MSSISSLSSCAMDEDRITPREQFPFQCAACSHYVKDRRASISETDVTKQLVKAWFKGTYIRADKHTEGDVFMIQRRAFLDQHVNVFLRSVGLPTWTTHSPLYQDWFLPKVVTMTVDEENNCRPWKFIRRTSKAAYRKRLVRLLDSLD